jgi:MinD-like ATPase involved in chromosome partitioning or flagellar assembly
MTLLSTKPTEAAQQLSEMLAKKYPELRNDIVSSPRLIAALESACRITELDSATIFDALTTRELATAQRPVGVLVSRCLELIEMSVESAKPIKAQKPAPENADTSTASAAAPSSPVHRATSTAAVRASSLPPDRIAVQKTVMKKSGHTPPSVSDRLAGGAPGGQTATPSARPPAPSAEKAIPEQPTAATGATSAPNKETMNDRNGSPESNSGPSANASNGSARHSNGATQNATGTTGPQTKPSVLDETDKAVTTGHGSDGSERGTPSQNDNTALRDEKRNEISAYESAIGEFELPKAFVPELLRGPSKAIPQRGLRRALYRTTMGHLNLGLSQIEKEEIELMQDITSPISGSRNIVVLGLKGGVGKTTVSLALGHTFATHRHDRVVAIDASADPSSLYQRVERQGGSIRDLLAQRSSIHSYADLRELATQQSTGLEVLSSDRVPSGQGILSYAEFDTAIDCLSAYFNLIVTDSGSNATLNNLDPILRKADQLVIVTAPMVDAGWSTGLLLDWLDANGYPALVADSTVVVNHVQQNVEVKARDFDSYFQRRCRSLVHVQWDAALAAGGLVSLDEMSRAACESYRLLAATIATNF